MHVMRRGRSRSFISFAGSLPMAALLFVFANGLYIALVAFGNITDPAVNYAFVQHVLSMDTTNFGGDPDANIMWRAITAEPLQVVAYVALIAWEAIAAVVLLVASVQWFMTLKSGRSFVSAGQLASIGLLMLVVLFFIGFTAIGGEYFSMWSSKEWNGLNPAFQNAVRAGIALILVHFAIHTSKSINTLNSA